MTATREQLDVSAIRGRDVKALALLADALGWRVNTGVRGVSFSSESDHFNLPDNDGLKQSVFVSKIKHLCRHSGTRPSDGRVLAEAISDTVGLRKSHRRQFVSAVVDSVGGSAAASKPRAVEPSVEPPPKPAPAKKESVQEPEPVEQERHVTSEEPDSDAVMRRIWSDGTIDYACRHPNCDFVRPTPMGVVGHQKFHGHAERRAAEAAEAARHIVSESPYQRVRLTKPKEGITVYEDSEAIITREWSDGTVVYACRHCDKTSDNPRSIGSHQRAHTKDVEQPPAPLDEEVVEEVVAATIEPDEMTAEQVLGQIAELVDRGRASQLRADNERLVTDNERLRAEMAEVRQRADRLEANLLVLRELMSEIGKDADGST